MLVMLFWGCIFQLLTLILFFWVDFIQGFGYSTNFSEFYNHFANAWTCFFGLLGGCQGNGPIGLVFIAGYFISYFSGAGLNESSATYGLVATTLTSPVVIVFYLLFPSLNLNNTNSPLWSVLPSVFLMVLGTIVWKLWENKEKRKNLEYESVPTALGMEE